MKNYFSLKNPEEKDFLTGKINQFTTILGMIYCCVDKKDYDLFDDPDSIESYLEYHKKLKNCPATKNINLKLRSKKYEFLFDDSKNINSTAILEDFISNVRFHLMQKKIIAYGITGFGFFIPVIPFLIPNTLTPNNIIPTIVTTVSCSLMCFVTGIVANLVYFGNCNNWFLIKWLLISVPTCLNHLETLRNEINNKIFIDEPSDAFYPMHPDDRAQPLIDEFHKSHNIPDNFLYTLEEEGYIQNNGNGTFYITKKQNLWMIISVFVKLQKISATKLYSQLFMNIKDKNCVYRNNHNRNNSKYKKDHSKIDEFIREINNLCKKY